MLHIALSHRVPFGKFSRASAFPAVRLRRTAGASTRTVVLCNHGAVRFTAIEMPVKNFGATGKEGESNGEGYSEACFH